MWWKYYLLFSTTTFVVAVSANLPDPLGIAADIINDHDKRLCDFEKAVGLPSCQTWPPLPAGISKSSTTTPTSTSTETGTTQKSDTSPTEITSRFGLPPQQILQRASPPHLIQFNHQSLTRHLYLLEQGRPTEYGNIPQQTYQAQTAAEYPPTHQRARQAPFPEQRVPNRVVAGQQLQQQQHLQQQQQQLLQQQQQQLQQHQPQQQQLRPQRRLAAQTQLPHLKTMPHQLPPIQFHNGPEAIDKGFNTKLHQLISTYNPNLNVVYSPISLQAALALIYTGANGQTAQELQTALDLPANKIKVLEMFQSIPKSRQSGEFTLNMLGRLFYNQNLRVVPQFVANAREHFDSDVTPVNFANPQVAANQINQWVAQRTNHRIRDLIAPQTLDPRTSAMLVNAVYFKAKWFNEFSSDETTNDEFFVSLNQQVPVRMMNNEDTFRYAELPDYHAKVLQLPYKDTDMSMLIILPYEVNGLAAMENRFQNVDLRRLLREVKPETVKVQLPKFRVEFDLDMVEALKRLNIKTLFSSEAELQGIFENQATGISSIRQKAFIDVNEAGSEAAAITYTKFIPLSLPSNLKEFRADHPFMFAIVSPQAVYFAGHVVRF